MSMIWPANICHGFDQQLLFINVNTFLNQWQENEICEFWFWNWRIWNFVFGIVNFGIVHFGILILEFCFWNSDVQNCACKT
jgi:hypothetical protein